MKIAATIIATILAVLAGLVLWSGSGSDSSSAKVVHVTDGDSIVVESAGVEERVRLLNIDAPEFGTNDPVETCFAQAATDFLAARLEVGMIVDLVFDVEQRDQYGRLLAGVMDGKKLVNAEIASAGLATSVYFEPNDYFLDEVGKAEAEAKAAKVGMFDPAHPCYA